MIPTDVQVIIPAQLEPVIEWGMPCGLHRYCENCGKQIAAVDALTSTWAIECHRCRGQRDLEKWELDYALAPLLSPSGQLYTVAELRQMCGL